MAPASETGPAVPVAPNIHPVMFHGVTVQIPDAWKFHDTQCGIPVHDTWTVPGAEPACGLSQIPDVTSVQFGELSSVDTTATKGWKVTRITLPGSTPVAAVLSQAPDGTTPFSVWITVPSRSASVRITAHQRATVETLVRSVTITPEDGNGCSASADDVNALTAGRPAVRAGAAEALIPDGVRTISVCRYVAGYLEQSASVTGASATAFADVFDAAPTGWSVASTQTYSKDLCRNPKSVPGEMDDLTSADAEAYRIEAGYPTGPAVVVLVRLSICGNLGESNGTRSGQETAAIADQLVKVAGNAQGWPGSLEPAR